MTSRDAQKMEFIGRRVEVTRSGDPTLGDVAGLVVDETRNTLVVEVDDGRELRVPKSGQVFRFSLENGTAEVEGASIAFAPEDRTKKAR